MLGVIADITATKAREALVRESEARFRAMADSAPAPVWVTSAEGPIEFVNNAFAEFAGQPREALLGDAWIRQMHPDDVAAAVAHREAARKSDPPRAYWMEARFKHASGQWRWIRASSEPRFDDAGVFQGYVGLAIDMTEIRASEGRQRLLINELNHRVKNTLATVQSLAEQTSRMSQSKDEFKDRFLARLMALSAAHTRLTASSWNWTGLAGLVRDQLTLHGGGSENLSAEGPEVEVPPRAALSLSLALHELATNAVKYGALTAPGGQVLVRWDVVRDSDGRPSSLIMHWIERGGPPVVPPAVKGFGSRLLRLVGRDLEGEVDYQFAPEGVHWRVSFPLPARGEDDAVDLGPIL